MLDLFAGCGALGIEALSRGASSAVFVERDRRAVAALRRNLRELDLIESTRVIERDVGRVLAREELGGPFDLVLADPPYDGAWASDLVSKTPVAGLLSADGVLVVERSRRTEPPSEPPELIRIDGRTYGETAFDWYQRNETLP